MINVSIGPDGGSGSRMMGSPTLPISPEKRIRRLPPSVTRRSTDAEPRMWPAAVGSASAVPLLDGRRGRKHDGEEMGGRGGGENGALIAVAYREGEPADMV